MLTSNLAARAYARTFRLSFDSDENFHHSIELFSRMPVTWWIEMSS